MLSKLRTICRELLQRRDKSVSCRNIHHAVLPEVALLHVSTLVKDRIVLLCRSEAIVVGLTGQQLVRVNVFRL